MHFKQKTKQWQIFQCLFKTNQLFVNLTQFFSTQFERCLAIASHYLSGGLKIYRQLQLNPSSRFYQAAEPWRRGCGLYDLHQAPVTQRRKHRELINQSHKCSGSPNFIHQLARLVTH